MRWLVVFISILFSTLVVAQEAELLTTAAKSATLAATADESQNSHTTNDTIAPNETLPEVGKHVGGSMDAMTMIVSLLLVLVLIVLCAFVLKRIQPKGFDNKNLKVVTSMQLGAKERLVVVQVGDKQQLLGVTPQQISLLDTLDKPLEVSPPISTELGQSLVSFMQKHLNNNKNTLKKEPN